MFKPQQRKIYRYWNGTKEVCADPMRLSQRLMSDYPKESTLEHDYKLLQIDKPESIEALARIAQCARNVFRLAEIDDDGNGVTDEEAIMILVDFSGYLDSVKKNMYVMPTLPKSTVPTSCDGEANQTTKPISVSGSTETVPLPAVPSVSS